MVEDVPVEPVRFKDYKPFYRLHEPNPDDKSRVITLRINAEEEAIIKDLRSFLDVEAEGKAIKIAFKVGYFVLLNIFGKELLSYISSRKRERKSDYEKPQKNKNDVFVTPKNEDL